jgi:hypothetical protein
MAGCAFCKSEAEFYEGGVPICVRCSDARASKRKPPTSEHQVLNALREDLHSAKERASAATAAFDAVTSEIPSALPQPGGTQRIHQASREVTIARMEMLRAHHRLSDFLNAGIVPEDLKHGRGS